MKLRSHQYTRNLRSCRVKGTFPHFISLNEKERQSHLEKAFPRNKLETLAPLLIPNPNQRITQDTYNKLSIINMKINII